MNFSQKTKGQGVWSPSTVHRMLRSPTYIGQSYYNKREYIEATKRPRKPRNDKRPKRAYQYRPQEEWIKIPVPAILNLDTWTAVQSLMDRGKIAGALTRQKHEYLFLSGRAKCGRCHCAMSGFYRADRATRYYRCSANKQVASEDRCWRTVHALALEDISA
jgi:site-specific DNA recombinase